VRVVAALGVVLALSGAPTLVERSEQTMPLAITFNQGIARVDGGWIVSGTNGPLLGTDALAHVDDALNVLAVQPLAIPPAVRLQGYDHIGDIDVVGGVIYAPFEQPSYELGHQVTARYDASTLAFIDSVELAQHENSFVTVDEATMTAYSMDRFDGDSLLRYDVTAGWAPLPPLQLTMLLHHTQGADIADGAVWISTSDEVNGVYRVDITTGETTAVGSLGHVGAEGEGIDTTPLPSGHFHGLVNDTAALAVHLGHYDLVDGAEPSGAGAGPGAEGAASPDTTATSPARLPATGGSEPWGAIAAIAMGWCARALTRAVGRSRG
jgi:hypothetical protein